MPTQPPDHLRTVAVLGHSHEGKTTLCEALLHTAGATQRLGSTDQGTSILDHEPEEQRHSISVSAAIAAAEWQGYRVTVIDTPGFPDFAGEVAQALVAAEGAVLVVNATGTLAVGAELAWQQIATMKLPTLVVVNRMDKDNAVFEATVDALRELLGRRAIAVAVPLGAGEAFSGYVDLIDDVAYRFDQRGGAHPVDFPEELRGDVERAHAALVEAVVETDDALLERYLDGGDISDNELRTTLHAALVEGRLIPIVAASALQQKGAALVLDCITRYLPAPTERHRTATADGHDVPIVCDPDGPLVAHAIKTVADPFGKISYLKVLRGTLRPDMHPYNVNRHQEERLAQLGQPVGKQLVPATAIMAGEIAAVTKLAVTQTGDTLCAKEHPVTMAPIAHPPPSYAAAIHARSQGDEDKISAALHRQEEEDRTFHVARDEVTGEQVAHGLGDTHLAITLERIERKFGVKAALSTPRVAYLETISAKARSQHKYKKQSGGAGLYGDCTIEIEPLARGEGFIWEDKVFGGSIPQQFRPSVEKGVKQTIAQGVLAGYPLVDVRVRLVDGSTHPVDGKDIAFQLAGAMAMRKAVQDARPVLLEPVYDVTVTIPDRLMGDVISLLNGRRGRVAGMLPLGDGRTEVTGQVPLAEMFTFPIDLRAATQGRGRYAMAFSHHEEVPHAVAQHLIAAHNKEHAAAAS